MSKSFYTKFLLVSLLILCLVSLVGCGNTTPKTPNVPTPTITEDCGENGYGCKD